MTPGKFLNWSCNKFQMQHEYDIRRKLIIAVMWDYTFCFLGYNEVTKQTSKFENVFYEDKKVCNKGRARYQDNLAANLKFPVSKEFAEALCALPYSYSKRNRYTRSAYMNFIEKWGTVRKENITIRLLITFNFNFYWIF